jgi:hypothetical protein
VAKNTSQAFANLVKDWVEVFRAGEQTDSNGKKQEWRNEDLDQMVGNFDANDRAPIVIGHPKGDSPAWGWVQSLKREGDKLYAKFADIAPKFLEWGQAGHIANRSVKILSTGKGFKLGHIGFLGASPPAVEGMEALSFKADAPGQTFEFSLNPGYWASLIARGQRRMRDFFIEQFGADVADRVLPSWDIENAERIAAELQVQGENALSPIYSASNPSTEIPMPGPQTFSQADVDAAVARARTEEQGKLAPQLKAAEFAKRLAANKTFVDGLVKDKDGKCRLTPAQASGLSEFLSMLEGVEVSEFAFSAEGAEKKVGIAQFAKDLLGSLPVQLELGTERATHDPAKGAASTFAAPAGTSVEGGAAALHARAKAYQADHPNTSWLDAVKAVGG